MAHQSWTIDVCSRCQPGLGEGWEGDRVREKGFLLDLGFSPGQCACALPTDHKCPEETLPLARPGIPFSLLKVGT